MTKKLTKKELARLEEIRREKRNLRGKLSYAVNAYRADVDATVRYYKLHDMNDKIDYYGRDLKDESEKQQLLENYEILKENGYKVNYDKDEFSPWKTIRWILKNEDMSYLYNGYKLEKPAVADDLYIDDFWWTKEETEQSIKVLLQYGYRRIHFFDNSTAALRNIHDLINLGCKVVDTNNVLCKRWSDDENYTIDKQGLIIELPEETNMEAE